MGCQLGQTWKRDRETYVVEVELDFVANVSCCGGVRKVEDPGVAYVDLVGCWCDAC